MQSPTNTISVFFYCTILVVCLSHQSDARDTINTSHPLRDDANESLVSAGGIFELGFFTPGPGGNNRYVGIWYHNMPRRVVWVANRDKPVTDSSGSFAIAEDGNLKVLSNRNAYAITDLKNAGVNSTVKLMDNGNLIFFDGPSLLWQSFNDPTDTFLPGMKMDDKMVLTSWSTSTDPASGDYTFQKYQELYEIQMRSVPYWRSGESGLSIIKNKMPYAVAYMLSGFNGLDESKYPSSGSQNKGKVSFNFTRSSNDNVSGLFMNGTGEIQYYRWSDGEWTFLWSEPKDTCSFYKYCGKFSICDSNRDPECNCLPGYQPVSKVDSNNGDYSVDCEKRKQIRCDNNANQSTFLNLSLTNFRASFQKFDKARNKEECEKECLNNCKCEAYYMSEKYNAKRTGESDVVPSCFIGTGDLENLCRVDGESRVQLNVRVDMDLKTRDCKPCGDIMIPYPLSTGPNCGDPLYSSFDCNDSTDIFYFKTLSRQYRVISINKENRTFGVRTEIANSCYARNFPREIVNQSSPFTVTNRCYERGIEIRWKPSLEPSCNVSGDCRDWPNSSCHARENGMSRCYCDQEYQWDGTSLNCVQGLTARDSRDCKLCGDIMIPYPLSTGPNCGDPLYSSFDCDKSTGIFHFQTLSGNYSVININKANRTFVIEVNSETANSCDARNLSRQIVKLNQSSPFTVTNGCYKRRIEISWKPPLEPSCNVSGDCRDWPNSSCHARANGMSRCYCDQEYQWDGTSLNCVQGTGRSLARWLKDVIIIIAVFAAVLLVCFFSYYLYRRKRMTRRKGSGENSGENPVVWSYESSDRQVSDLMDEENKSGVGVPFCSWESILAATENFSDVHKLGRGGFGPVYKGMFPGGQEIAVKRLSSYSVQGINEFRNEVVLIAKLQHRNLVRLLGYCIKENEKILLYEYMPNKSLDAFIFDKKLSMLLNWKKRFDIILGIARGVLYLHQDSRLRIIHRDLKTSNILLDEEMNPKISDFGLARIVEGKGTEASTNKVVGTYGYMSPEYVLEGLFSTKSDVFSFGVVVLEIISGKRNTGFYGSAEALNLLGYAWGLWSENKALDLMDPMLLESCEKSEVMKCINVGLLCVQEDPGDRPTMSNVVFMLGGEATVLPVPNQPAFVMRKHVFSTSSSSTKPGSISNELTMSQVEGR